MYLPENVFCLLTADSRTWEIPCLSNNPDADHNVPTALGLPLYCRRG